MNRDFWHSDDDEAVLAEYLAEHAYATGFDPAGSTFVVGFGDEDRLPTVEEPETVRTVCAVCATPLANIPQIGWRHLAGYRDRDGCVTPWPGD